MSTETYSPAWPHGELTPFLSELWYVMGTNRVHHAGANLQTSRTMLVVRDGARLTLVNTVRLDDDGLRQLEALGAVSGIVRLGAFHGRDDAFYRDRYAARLWQCGEHAELPIAGASAHAFATSRHPEAALLLEREGGILVTCDAVQNWSEVDQFFSAETGQSFEAAGLIRPVNIPSTWLGACEPEESDFERLLALPFRHLVTAHGPPRLDDAHALLTQRTREIFATRKPPGRNLAQAT